MRSMKHDTISINKRDCLAKVDTKQNKTKAISIKIHHENS